MRELYAGCDLHSNSNLVGVIDGHGKRVFKKKRSNGCPGTLPSFAPPQLSPKG